MTWKRYAALLLALLLALSLTACRGESRIEGLVVEVQTDEVGEPAAFVVEDYQGERTGVLLAEGTRVWPRGSGSWTAEELRASFQADLRVDAWAFAICHPRREKLETAEGEKVPAYWAASARVRGELRREAVRLRDGTPVDVLEFDDWGARRCRLADGTELLEVEEPRGPENYYVGGMESFDDLSPRVQEGVRAWYEEQGPLFNEREELEKSYAAYRALGEEFQCGWVRQDTTPTASNGKVMYFVTSLTLPQEYGGRIVCERQSGAAFDRETGEKFDNWDLFGVSEAEVRRRLPELCGWVDEPELREAMSEALEEDMLVFFPEHVSVSFPPGTLTEETCSYGISLDYKDAPEGFFQPWAVPEAREE